MQEKEERKEGSSKSAKVKIVLLRKSLTFTSSPSFRLDVFSLLLNSTLISLCNTLGIWHKKR